MYTTLFPELISTNNVKYTMHISELISTNNLKACDIQYEATEIRQDVESVFIKSGTDLTEAYCSQHALEIGDERAYVYIYHAIDGAIMGYQYESFDVDDEDDSLAAMIAEDFVKKIIE